MLLVLASVCGAAAIAASVLKQTRGPGTVVGGGGTGRGESVPAA